MAIGQVRDTCLAFQRIAAVEHTEAMNAAMTVLKEQLSDVESDASNILRPAHVPFGGVQFPQLCRNQLAAISIKPQKK